MRGVTSTSLANEAGAVMRESSAARHNRAAQLGRFGELKATEFYEARGARIVERNVRYNVGELDLIVQEPNGTVVFVEVKTRSSRNFGGAEAITPLKVARMRRAAARWLRYHEGVTVRFDALVVLPQPTGEVSLEYFPGIEEGSRG